MTSAPHRSEIYHPRSPIAKLSLFARDIKISHTVFALPWALLATFVAAGGFPHPLQLLLILCCMVAARTVAMAANRLLDAKLDALNPRTARRAIPAGNLSTNFYLTALLLCAAAFCLLTSGFYFCFRNPYPLALSLPALAFVSAYPFLKRFTQLCHYYLGAALALAPVCASIAITPHLTLPPVLMAAAVLAWTAGFDILYATQDYASDLATGVHSVPSRLGLRNALLLARLTHAAAATFLLLLGHLTPAFGPLYYTGAAVAVLLLVVEHSLVSPTDLSKLNLAFFTLNGVISLLLATCGILDVFV